MGFAVAGSIHSNLPGAPGQVQVQRRAVPLPFLVAYPRYVDGLVPAIHQAVSGQTLAVMLPGTVKTANIP